MKQCCWICPFSGLRHTGEVKCLSELTGTLFQLLIINLSHSIIMRGKVTVSSGMWKQTLWRKRKFTHTASRGLKGHHVSSGLWHIQQGLSWNGSQRTWPTLDRSWPRVFFHVSGSSLLLLFTGSSVCLARVNVYYALLLLWKLNCSSNERFSPLR